MTISEIKKEAKVKLQGKLGKTILLYVVYAIIIGLLESISMLIKQEALSTIYSIALLIITLPFSYGFVASLIKLSREEDVQVTDFITIGLQNMGRVWGVFGRTLLKLILPLILYIAAFVFCMYSIISTAINPDNGTMLIVSIILLVASIIYLIAKALLYGLSSYLIYDEENSSSKEIVEKSANLMNGNRWKYIGLMLSFIGWYLLIYLITIILMMVSPIIAIIFIFVGSFLLVPYVAFSGIGFYEDLNSSVTTTTDSSESTENKEEN